MTKKDNSNVNVEGTLDMTEKWKSIGDKTGETVNAVSNEQNGEDKISFWPEEIEDPSEMTELQAETVRRAVMNPSLDSNGIGDKIGKKGGYVRATLRRCCPEWYEEVFKNTRGENKNEVNPFLETAARKCGKCGEQIIFHERLDGKTLLRCKCYAIPVKTLVPTYWLRDFNE